MTARTAATRVSPDEVARRVARFRDAARDAGTRLTHQRLEIFREIASRLDHPDAETVFRALRPCLPTLSLDTVYRTLWLLHDLGLISTLGSRRESVRFDANPKHHHHYLCVRCGWAGDFELESADVHAVRLPAAVRKLGSIFSTRIEIWGLCQLCADKPMKTIRSPTPIGPKGKKGTSHGGKTEV